MLPPRMPPSPRALFVWFQRATLANLGLLLSILSVLAFLPDKFHTASILNHLIRYGNEGVTKVGQKKSLHNRISPEDELWLLCNVHFKIEKRRLRQKKVFRLNPPSSSVFIRFAAFLCAFWRSQSFISPRGPLLGFHCWITPEYYSVVQGGPHELNTLS